MMQISGTKAYESSLKNLWNALRFSSVVLFKIGRRDTGITGKYMGIDYRQIVRIEWCIGFYILAAFIITLKNTLPLVNMLFSGAF